MILLRHGQSEFNAAFTPVRRDPGIVDAPLTALGHAQAAQAAETLAGSGAEVGAEVGTGAGSRAITRVIASPYLRALQTAAPIARRLGLSVEISPLVRERFKFACDIGTPRSALAEAWPRHDFAAIEEFWWPQREEDAASVIERAARFRAAHAADPDHDTTLVVSHWGFILAMTGQSITNGTWVRCDPAGPAPAELVWKAPRPAA